MKISNSKKQLAKIINENGGWRDGAEFTAQDGDGTGSIDFFKSKPRLDRDDRFRKGDYAYEDRIVRTDATVKNGHQTVLSREEYFHLYQMPTAAELTDEERCIQEAFAPECKPSLEQLAADYHNRKDYADRKQQEADAAKADAETKRAELVAAGKALGLVLSVAGVEPEGIDGGWIEHTGNGCPVDGGEIVEVLLRDGPPSCLGARAARDWDWSIDDEQSDIVKWRRVKEADNA